MLEEIIIPQLTGGEEMNKENATKDNIVKQIWEDIMNAVYSLFTRIVFGYVRTHV